MYRQNTEQDGYSTFDKFYPFYIQQHSNPTNRRLHIIGTLLAILQLVRCILVGFTFTNTLLIFLIGYGLAWIGHYFFQNNRPATFKYPWFSFRGDLTMLAETLSGSRQF